MNVLPVTSLRRRAAVPPVAKPAPASFLSAHEQSILIAVAEAVMPQGRVVPGASADIVGKLARFVEGASTAHMAGIRALLWACEVSTLPTHRRVFTALDRVRREAFLERWSHARSFAARSLLRAIVTPIKAAHFDDPKVFARVSCTYEAPRAVEEKPRWLAQVTDGRELSEDTEMEAEVVVVGTGAGGAAAAYELASRGRAVLLLEEGHYHRRHDLNGRASQAFRALYRDRGITVALGNVGVPVWAGRAVGGSTIVNSGTCYRTPERTLRYWRERHGLPLEISATGLDPYFRRVEAMLEVTRAEAQHLGGVARVIGRGADALGLHHQALMRNAPACDGAGMCCYGCPSGAKRSTDVSYVPAALTRGAQLVTGARVDTIDVVAGRARGLRATLASGRTLRVKAEAVVVAGGALMTPLLLARSGIAGQSGWLGKNLSVHPASKVIAEFDELIDMGSAIPQGYAIEDLADEGLMFEGGSAPLDVTALGIPWTGRPLMDLLDVYRKLAMFGFMVQDHSRGSVREGSNGSPLIFYNLNARDTALMQRGLVLLTEIYLRAGARRVFPFATGHEEIRDQRGLSALREARLRPGDFDVAAFHPLGTCRAGADPRRSCVGPDHETHDTKSLFVCDGSVMPSSLGVNPQVTIMAMALRAAEGIDARLS